MDFITKEIYENNDIEEIVDDNGIIWLNEKHVEEKLDHNMICKKCGFELIN